MPTPYIPMVETQMLVRKPAQQVFQAFIDSVVTINFWFTKSSGQLDTGKVIIWEWVILNNTNTNNKDKLNDEIFT